MAQILEAGDQSKLAEADLAIQEEDHLGRPVRFEWEKAVILGPAQHSMASDCLLVALIEKVTHGPSLVEGHLASRTRIYPPYCVMR